MQVPPEKDILKRMKGFYSSRRSVALTKNDSIKSKKRKLAVKAIITYLCKLLISYSYNCDNDQIAREKAVLQAPEDGTIARNDPEAIKSLKN